MRLCEVTIEHYRRVPSKALRCFARPLHIFLTSFYHHLAPKQPKPVLNKDVARRGASGLSCRSGYACSDVDHAP